mmetsp:Transcript_25643/g.51807  ORF Transcript_25643/g.51807 Transcript_25643/m.51807 type:complete len:245 (+) Transcript_25643:847-1581(+)
MAIIVIVFGGGRSRRGGDETSCGTRGTGAGNTGGSGGGIRRELTSSASFFPSSVSDVIAAVDIAGPSVVAYAVTAVVTVWVDAALWEGRHATSVVIEAGLRVNEGRIWGIIDVAAAAAAVIAILVDVVIHCHGNHLPGLLRNYRGRHNVAFQVDVIVDLSVVMEGDGPQCDGGIFGGCGGSGTSCASAGSAAAAAGGGAGGTGVGAAGGRDGSGRGNAGSVDGRVLRLRGRSGDPREEEQIALP